MENNESMMITDDFLLSSYTRDKTGRTNFMNTSLGCNIFADFTHFCLLKIEIIL